MKITYDPSANAAYVSLSDDGAGETVDLTVPVDPIAINGMINLDFDSNGHLIGIEILDARSRLMPGMLADAELLQ